MRDPIEADQSGAGIEPLQLAEELGRVRALMLEAPAVVPRSDGQRHFRCESCGTISHGTEGPARCPTCGGLSSSGPISNRRWWTPGRLASARERPLDVRVV